MPEVGEAAAQHVAALDGRGLPPDRLAFVLASRGSLHARPQFGSHPLGRGKARVPEPKSQRPHIPGGYLSPKLLAWSWAEHRLAQSRNYWITSITPDGNPHARPVWGVWLDDCFYFSSGSRIRSNLAHHSAVSVNLESGDECIILEGRVVLVQDEAVAKRVASAYNQKYHWDMEAKSGEFLEVRPRVIFGWLCDGSGRDGGALFSQTATRWLFE
jgi:hypothetical protein